MPYLLIQQRVDDFETWKQNFDKQAATRRDAGSKGGWLFQRVDDRNAAVALLEWDDPNLATEFAQSRDVWQALGQPEMPDESTISSLEEADEPAV
jgi:hypothetical protein